MHPSTTPVSTPPSLEKILVFFHEEENDSNENDDANDVPTDEIRIDLSNINDIIVIEKYLEVALSRNLPSMPGRDSSWEPTEGILLYPPPTEIKDQQSAILGSAFHAAHRIDVPSKKSHPKKLCSPQ